MTKASGKSGLGSVPSVNRLLPAKRCPGLPGGPQAHPPGLFVRFVRGSNLYGHASQIAGGHNSGKVAVKRSSNLQDAILETVTHLGCKDCQMMHQRAL